MLGVEGVAQAQPEHILHAPSRVTLSDCLEVCITAPGDKLQSVHASPTRAGPYRVRGGMVPALGGNAVFVVVA